MNKNLEDYLKYTVRIELKWMYHYEVDDDMFGLATDRYTWCKNVLDESRSVDDLLKYFKKNYAKHEQLFISKIEELWQ